MKKSFRMSILALLAVILLADTTFAQSTQLQNPLNTSVCIPLNPYLQWANPPNHFQAKVMIATDSSFSNLVLMQDNLTNQFLQTTVANYNTKYYWKVITSSSLDTTTSHSAIWSFTTRQAPIILQSPQNEFCVGTSVVLNWDSAQYAANYRVEYSTDINFPDTNRMSINYANGTFTQINNLMPNTRYYWRVRGNFLNCDGYWSLPNTFRTKPAPASIAYPLNGSQGLPLFSAGFPFNPTLSWHPVAHAHHYELQLSDSANFSSFIIDRANIYDTTFAVIDTLKETYNKTYFWRVKAVVNNDSLIMCQLDWSANNSFKTPYKKAVLAKPVVDSTCVSLTPTLNWHPVTGAAQYSIWLSSKLDFSDTLHMANAYADTIIVFPLAKELSEYYWKVRAADGNNAGYWSNTSKFTTTLMPPKGLFPKDSATGVHSLVHFVWAEKDTNAIYRLQVSMQMNFATYVFEANNLTEPMTSMDAIYYNKAYFWRLQVTIGNCTSAWSKPMRFKTYIAPPVLLEPADSATAVNIFPTFKWEAVIAAATYEIWIDSTLNFTTALSRIGIPANEIRILSPLVEYKRYYWKVRAYNEDGVSEWSETRTFMTGYIMPTAPILISPTNESVMHPINDLKLIWNSSPRATSYHLQVTKLISFSNLVLDTVITDTTYTLSGLDNFVTYQYRVRAQNGGGFSDWSYPFAFRTINVAPITPSALISPANNSVNQPINLKLVWSEVSKAEAYRFQLATDSAFTNIIQNEKTIYVLYRNIYGLEFNKTFYWRVQAWNEAGEGPWSEIFNFKTETLISVKDVTTGDSYVKLFPNPATNYADLNFNLNESAFVKLRVFNSQGNEIHQTAEERTSGENSLRVNLLGLPAGAYFWQMDINGTLYTGSMSVIK